MNKKSLVGDMDGVQFRTVSFWITHLCGTGSGDFDVTGDLSSAWVGGTGSDGDYLEERESL